MFGHGSLVFVIYRMAPSNVINITNISLAQENSLFRVINLHNLPARNKTITRHDLQFFFQITSNKTKTNILEKANNLGCCCISLA